MKRINGPTRHSAGYVLVRAEDHPRAVHGRVCEHVLVVERALGRLLPSSVAIHHVNEIKSDNRNCNLVVLQNQGEHIELHARLRVLRAGGDPWTQRMCCVCHQPKAFGEFYAPKDRRISSRCKQCSRDRFPRREAA